jgi:2-polyprenyl-3-methyl-5-hydroxy-6-metoxy-1,4-benzoquinol methylase
VTELFVETLPTEQVLRRIRGLVDVALPREGVEVLEAGCGSVVRIDISPRKRAVVTGVDISARQLERNQGLDCKVHDDLERTTFPDDQYDLVVCWDVLEHLAAPRTTLARLVATMKADGLLVIGVPNLLSVKGLITKLTPHSVHIWYHRRILGWDRAGTDDIGPFRTPFRTSLRPRALVRDLAALGLEPVLAVHHRTEAMDIIRAQRGLLGIAIRTVSAVLRVVSLGRVRTTDADVVIVARRAAG